MIAAAISLWKTTIRRPGVWTGIVWAVLFALLWVVLVLATGQRALLTRTLHPATLATPAPAPTAGAAVSVLVMYVILLGVGPFWMAGMYGMYGRAIKGETVGFRTFWQMGRKFYGRGWGLLGYTMLYGIALGLVAVGLIVGLKVAGEIVLGALVLLSLPWVIRMTGRLFVDGETWGASFRGSFRGGHFWALVGGILLAVVAYAIVYALFVLLGRVSIALAAVVYILFDMGISVAGPLWAFALYHAEANA